MPFRDDEEARAARTHALEVDLEEERRKRRALEEQLAGRVTPELPAPKQRSKSKPHTGSDDAPSSWRTRILYALVGVGVVALFAFFVLQERWLDAYGEGKLRHAHLVSLRDGRPVLLVAGVVLHESETGTDAHERLDLIDVADGRRLAREQSPGLRDCLGATPGLLWCRWDEQVEVRDVATLRVTRSSEELAKVLPALADGLHDAPAVDRERGDAIVTTKDGRRWRIAPEGDRVEAVTSDPPTGSLAIDPVYAPSRTCEHEVAEGTVALTAGLRPGLVIRHRDGSTRSLGDGTFLGSSLLCASDAKLIGAGHGMVLVVHAASLAIDAERRVTAVALDGRVRWTVPLGVAKIAAAWTVGDRVVIALDGETGAVLSIALDDGRVSWRTST